MHTASGVAVLCLIDQSYARPAMKRTAHHRRIPRVVAVVSMESNFGPSVLRGVFAHVAERGEWGLSIVRSAKNFTAQSVREAIDHKVSGMIVALNENPEDAFDALAASHIPFATVETYSPQLHARRENAVHVRIDNAEIGRDAARSFVAQGRYASFGYVSTAIPREWSRLRGEGFSREMERRDRAVETFLAGSGDDHITRRGELAKWLRRLAKPAAVLAADDAVAQEVLQACASARLSVPGEVSVLGIDDEELVCENATPTLSSIRPDCVRAGKTAAAALEKMMRGKDSRPTATVVIHGGNEIVRRASTPAETTSGPLVQKALAFIEKNARRGIGVKDVQEHLKVSRSLMDLRFREVRGESVLSVILSARLAELKRLLRGTDDSIESITRQLGWSSPNYPKNLFKKRFGMSMSHWRMQSTILRES